MLCWKIKLYSDSALLLPPISCSSHAQEAPGIGNLGHQTHLGVWPLGSEGFPMLTLDLLSQ